MSGRLSWANISFNLKKGTSVHGVMDNFDKVKNILSCMGGTHDTLLALFQDKNVKDMNNDVACESLRILLNFWTFRQLWLRPMRTLGTAIS